MNSKTSGIHSVTMGILQDVILTGVDNRIEVWSKDNWNVYNGEVEPDVTTIAASLAELGI